MGKMPAISTSENCVKPPPSKHVVMDSKDAEGNLPRSENSDNKTDAIPSIEQGKTKKTSRDLEGSSALATLHDTISDQSELSEATKVEQEVCDKNATTSTKKPDSLRQRLIDIRTEAPIRSWKFFFPDDGVRRLIVPNKIQTELRALETDYTERELDDHTEIIYKKSPRLFAILVFLKLSRYIYDFISEGIDDADLPFLRCDKSALILCSNKSQGKCIECMKDWDLGDVEDFNRTQYSMLSPVFDFGEEIQHQDLHDGCILPFIEDYGQGKNHKATEGGYGMVWKIKIHPAHQITSNQEDSEAPYSYIAIKRLHFGNHSEFTSEVEMLKTFRKKKHKHLVKLLATYRYCGAYYLLFPYADSNLRQYWQRTPVPDFSSTTVRWVLQQCKELASGLHTVHEHRSTDETMSSVTSSQPEVTAAEVTGSEDGIRRYGRHGDIKPENILWFDKVDKSLDDSEQGFLVIADFGLTDLHRRGTRSDIPAMLISGTPTYEPPELQLNGTISRAYDIWSLGCTFLEFITWLVCGWDVLDQFPEARKMPTLRNLREDTFFHIPPGEPKTAIICKGVVLWIAEMRQLSRCSSFVEDFLDLISEKMLVIEPQARINAGGLNTKLKEMIRKATEDPYYLTQRRGKRRRQQEDQCDGYIQHEFMMHSLPNGTVPVPNKRDGEPLPKRRQAAITSQRFRSLSPPTENHFYADIPK